MTRRFRFVRSHGPRLALAAAAACCLITIPVAHAQGQRGAQAAAPKGPMAPEKYKNIQLLTDVPADQLDVTMQYIAASTGTTCLTCHVQDPATGVWAYEKDDKRSKQTAREMIKIVQTINNGNFGINASCATCHAGHNQPQGLQLAEMMSADQIAQINTNTATRAAMPPRQGGPGAPGAPGGQRGGPPAGGAPGQGRGQAPQGPPVADILNKYVDAIGGHAALTALQSLSLSGTMTNRAAQSIVVKIDEKGPRFREVQQTDPAAQTIAFDGTAGWAQVGDKTYDFGGFRLEQTQRTLDAATLALDITTKYPNLQSSRPARLDGREVNILRGTSTSGAIETFYFDAATGLLVRRQVTTRTPLGSLPERIDYTDYRDVGGVKLPYQITHTSWSVVDTFRVVDAKANAPIDDAVFGRPR